MKLKKICIRSRRDIRYTRKAPERVWPVLSPDSCCVVVWDTQSTQRTEHEAIRRSALLGLLGQLGLEQRYRQSQSIRAVVSVVVWRTRIHRAKVTRCEHHDKCRGENDRVTRYVQHEAIRLYARTVVTPISKDSPKRPKGSVCSSPFLRFSTYVRVVFLPSRRRRDAAIVDDTIHGLRSESTSAVTTDRTEYRWPQQRITSCAMTSVSVSRRGPSMVREMLGLELSVSGQSTCNSRD